MNNSIKKVPCVAATTAENTTIIQQNNNTDSSNCQILPCPCCGSPAVLKSTGVYGDKAYRLCVQDAMFLLSRYAMIQWADITNYCRAEDLHLPSIIPKMKPRKKSLTHGIGE